MKKILLFGSFDGIHQGHENLVSQAEDLGDEVTIALASSQFIEKTKKSKPVFNEKQRKEFLENHFPNIKISTCDEEINSWNILKKINPDIILVGYDQDDMEESLKKFITKNSLNIEVKKAESFKPEFYKSSIINKNK
jgi:FAD synthetase